MSNEAGNELNKKRAADPFPRPSSTSNPSLLSDDDFDICEMIGTGVSSCVYRAIHRVTGRVVALKKINWGIAPERIAKEIRWMLKLNHPHICRLVTVYRNEDSVTLVLEYIPHLHHRLLFSKLKGKVLKHYIFQLTLAIEYLHSCHIIHHDIKPGNFLFDPETCIGSLIDYGLCETDMSIEVKLDLNKLRNTLNNTPKEFTSPKSFNSRPKLAGVHGGTRGYLAPEVLVKSWNVSPKVDVWSAGVILLSVLTKRFSFFSQEKGGVSLCEMAAVFGEDRIIDCALEAQRRVLFPCPYKEKRCLKEIAYGCNAELVTEPVDENVWDLLDKMLDPVPSARYSSKEVINHPYFDDIRDEYNYCLQNDKI